MVEAQQFLHDRYGDRATVPTLLGTGGWSTAFAFELDGRDVVLKLGKHGEDFAKDATMGAMAAPGLPIPRVLDHGRDGDEFFAIAERCHGVALDTLDGEQMQATLPSLVTLLAAISAVDVDAIPGPPDGWPRGDGTSWSEGLLHLDSERPRLGGWRQKLSASPVGTSSFDLGMAAMRDLTPSLPDSRQLIHNDLLAGNVLVQDGAITGIFDWGNAMVGDPLYERAILRFWWPWFPQWSAIDIAAELSTPAAPDVEQRLLAYELHIGLDHLQYNAWVGRTEDLIRTDEQVRRLLGEPTVGASGPSGNVTDHKPVGGVGT